ncbi:MAG: threonine synthase [Planctomycetaceae bacterium]|nr:MAG: threonine synthase [Planctomycetaceae bacterium]
MVRVERVFQRCMMPTCGYTLSVSEVETACPRCGGLLDVGYEWDKLPVPASLKEFEARWCRRNQPLDFSGVWRFRELLPFAPQQYIVTIGEGQTLLQRSDYVARYVGLNPGCLFLQYEGLNPSGSFKDNGMTAAATHARMVGARIAACASTGNTSASLAIYASSAQVFRVVVFVGSGRIAYGKLSQALDYQAVTLQIRGDFDDALARVREVARERGIYLCNSVNPFRLEGQKTIMYRVLESLDWQPPDWVLVPGGNLGNSSAFGKAFVELKQLGLITQIPRLAVINAQGANTLFQLYEQRQVRWNDGRVNWGLIDQFYHAMTQEHRRAHTLASAIEINRPVNLAKCLRALDDCGGVVREVSDQMILDAKAVVGAGGFGCEPASAASVAGARLLREQGVIAPSDRVVCILTGHQLKDPTATVAYHARDDLQGQQKLRAYQVYHTPFANHPVEVDNDLQHILSALPDHEKQQTA